MSVQRPVGSGPAGTGAQVPALPARLQALQAPHAALAQQTPSVHMPLRQSAPPAQVEPSGFRFVQMPPWQVYPVTQSASAVQAVRQAAGPHTKWAGQAIDVGAQVPVPLQVLTMLLDPAQVVGAQLVPAPVFRQAPAPLHVPSNPQGGLAGQSWCGSALPAATGWQDPALPERLHAWQVPQLPAPQQTPSTQYPLAQSLPAAQICPRRLSPHDPALQNCPAAQSASLAHTATQAACVVALQT
jgi:hypothetical protein